MANARSNGPHGNGGGAPGWARELSADVRAVILEMREDRKQAAEDRARHTREMAKAIAVATRVGIQIRQDIQAVHHEIQAVHKDIRLLHEENRRTLDAVHELTGSIEKLVRVSLSGRNGRGGNGRRFKA